MDEETLRKTAIEQYLQGKPPALIYSELGRTKTWFFLIQAKGSVPCFRVDIQAFQWRLKPMVADAADCHLGTPGFVRWIAGSTKVVNQVAQMSS